MAMGVVIQVPGYKIAAPQQGSQQSLVSKAESAFQEAKAKVENKVEPKAV